MMKDRGLLRHANERDMEFEDLGMKTEGAIKTMEVVLRGFGRGRDAVVKALMGNEGRGLRDRVIRVSDSTRLKFGGTRSPKPRRLG
jgi:small subunit ribosomal protein S11